MRCVRTYLLGAGLAIIWGASAHACPMVTPSVGLEDVTRAPENMIAVQAVITKIDSEGDMSSMPHQGFEVQLKVKKIFQGSVSKDISIAYGPCHHLPGKVGDVIYALALKGDDGWYAPQFWNLRDGTRR
jgi:hypothetical protein